ncbi:MAG TPA: hypothetical protein VK906_10420 [Egicoccus sp.]|nr:hypothetical protein [Egicoccus sp.]HSK23582.1 hypothetical protein [Egicoccus sp.]
MGHRTGPANSALAVVIVVALSACAGTAVDTAGTDPGSADSVSVVAEPQVRIDGDTLVLSDADGTERVVAVTDPVADGELLHATLRPGDRERQTVLAVARAQGDGGARYELRYLSVDGDEVTDLYWFPWRLQVADDLAATLDRPPVPVWSPDGDAVAWLEWGSEGTRLRTVAWHDEVVTSNPSDDAATYRLEEVPAGTWLEAWDLDQEGRPVLRGRDGDTMWRIVVDADAATAMAMADGATA